MKELNLNYLFIFLFIAGCSHTKIPQKSELNSNEFISIVYTSQLNGQLKDCGCSHDPKGGLSAREKHYKNIQEIIPNMILLDSGASIFEGNNFKYPPKNKDEDLIEAKTLLSFHKKLGYAAQALGLEEIKYGQSTIENLLLESKIPGIASNINLDKNSPIKDHLEIDRNSKKIVIFSLISPRVLKNSNLKAIQPNEAITKQIKKYPADLYVILNNLEYTETLKLLSILSNTKTPVVILGSNSNNKSMLLQKKSNAIWIDSASSYQSYGIINLKIEKSNSKELQIILPKEPCKKGQSGYPELADACYFNLETRINP
ncbi:MAG: hypothetical protein KA116_12995 [Proteobacteria bacterium]|nr:hypothetical protein [Pseudomonadota bacterium]